MSPCRESRSIAARDNRTVLHDILGYDDAKLDDLESSGVLSSRIPRPPS
jgi:hypothetical protein